MELTVKARAEEGTAAEQIIPPKPKRRIKKEWVYGWLMSSPPLIGFLVFTMVPLVLSVVMSFSSMQGYQLGTLEWAGIANFKYILTDPLFYKSLGNTFYAALSVPISMVLALLIAVFLNQKLRGKKIFRVIFFIPYVCSVVALTIMWKWMFDYEFGIINGLLASMGITKVDWLGSANAFMPAMIIMNVWSGMGFNLILFSAALTNVNDSYYEAADLDGANRWNKFWHITVPGISPTTFYLLIMGLIGALQDFARFQIISPTGGPNEAGLTSVLYLYNMGFRNVISFGMGYASAAAWLLTVIILAITYLNFKLSDKWVHYD